jgi:metal-responsive CopG/Arc/MetJ family transcriptional regulator
MQRTNIYLADSQVEDLDRIARNERTSRAAVIRRLIDRGLGERSLDDDLDAIRGSFGALADDGPELADRGPDERSRHLDRVWRGGG